MGGLHAVADVIYGVDENGFLVNVGFGMSREMWKIKKAVIRVEAGEGSLARNCSTEMNWWAIHPRIA